MYIFINLRSLLLYYGVNCGTRFHRDRYTSVSTASYGTVHLLIYIYVSHVEDTACSMAKTEILHHPHSFHLTLFNATQLYILQRYFLEYLNRFPLTIILYQFVFNLQSPLPPLQTVPLWTLSLSALLLSCYCCTTAPTWLVYLSIHWTLAGWPWSWPSRISTT